jgi:hypothetical protein
VERGTWKVKRENVKRENVKRENVKRENVKRENVKRGRWNVEGETWKVERGR